MASTQQSNGSVGGWVGGRGHVLGAAGVQKIGDGLCLHGVLGLLAFSHVLTVAS
jgi:hypothetical protein